MSKETENDLDPAGIKTAQEENKSAEKFAKKHIVPKFDDLINRYKNEGAIPKEEVRDVIYSILEEMRNNKLVDSNHFEIYVGKTSFDYTSLKMVSELDETIDALKIFDEKDELVAPKIETLRDKLNYAAYKVFSNAYKTFSKIGFGSASRVCENVGMACRNMMSSKTKDDFNKFEEKITGLMAAASSDVMTPKDERHDKNLHRESIKTATFHEQGLEKVKTGTKENASASQDVKTAKSIKESINPALESKAEMAGKYAQAIAAERREKTSLKNKGEVSR